MTKHFTLRYFLLLLLMGVVGESWGQVAWINGAGSTTWYTSANWTPGRTSATWLTSDIAQFNDAGTATSAGINMTTSSLSIGAIEVSSARTRSLNIGNSTATNGTLTLNATTVNGINNTILRNNSAFELTLKNTVGGTGDMGVVLGNMTDNIINTEGTGGITISSIISGSGPLTKIGTGGGAGVLTLSAVNTYTGKTFINEGFINANNENVFGTAPGSFTSDQITLDGGGIQVTTAGVSFINTSTRGITIGAGGGKLDVYSGDLTVANVITGTGSLAKTGSTGTVVLAGANTYTGNTIITGGTMQLTNANTLASPTCFINGGNLQISTSQTLNNISISSGTLTVDAGITLTINGTLTISGGTISSTGTITYGPSGILQYGTSMMTGIEWTSSNTPSAVNITAGIVTLANAATTSGNLTISGTARLVGTGYSLTVGGDWNSTSTNPSPGGGYTGGSNASSSVTLAGSGARTFVHTGGATFRNLTISGTGIYTSANDINMSVNTLTFNNSGGLDMGINTLDGSGNLTMSNGILRQGKLNTTLPELIGVYLISGGTIELNGAGAQELKGSRNYANLTFSNSGTKTISSSIGPANTITGTATIANTVILDVGNSTFGGAGTNLVMTETSKFINGGNGVKPDASGSSYTLSPTSTIEFTFTSATLIRVSAPAPLYGNIIISGSNVSLFSDLTSIKMQASPTTFTVTNTGTFNVQSSTGFTGAASAAVSNSPNNPAIDLQAGSTINYNGVAQPLTPRSDYKNLTISGSGAKTAASAFNVAETFTRSGTATLATTSPTYGTGATLAYVDPGNGRTYTAGLEWPITNPPTNLTLNLSGTGTRVVTMPGSRTVGGNIALTAGELSIGANTLTANGAFSYGSGTLTGTAAAGASTSNLTLGGAAGTLNFTQATAVTRSLNNLILNSASSAILGTALDLYGSIGLTSATLDLNAQHLILKSNATNTARIADLTGSTLSNATNVTVERWIPLRGGSLTAGGRAYRLLASTVLTTTPTSSSIKDSWMEGGQVTTVGGTNNPVPGFGTHITGGTVANGFDQTQTNQASLYLTNNAVTPTYTSIANVNGNLNPYTGYFLFIRGGRDQLLTVYNTNVPPTPVPLPTSSTTLRATGTLQQGTKGNAAFTNAIVPIANTMNLITNPYPSALDWSAVYSTTVNLKNAYTLWDPNVGYRGGWITVNYLGVVTPQDPANTGSAATIFIQPGQAFFVETNFTAATSVSIRENQKAVGNNNGVFLVDPLTVQSFSTSLFYYEGTGNRRLADGVTAIYDNSFSASVDGEDASEINNWDENIAIEREGKHLAIESRPLIVNKDTLPLFMNNMKLMNYELEFKGANFNNDATTATLIDNFTGIRTGLSTSGTTVVPITVSSNPASAASNRFMVVFGGAAGPLPIDLSSVKAYEKNAGIQVDWVMNTEQDMDRYEVEKSADGRNFAKATTVLSRGNSSVQVNYGWFDVNPIFGDNFYRIKSIDKGGQYKNSNIVRVNLGKGGGTDISMYPNPFEGTGFNLQMDKLAAGKYTMTMYNNLGQRVYSGTVTHSGGSATQYIELGKDLAAGTYTVKISGGGTTELTRTITKK